MATSEIELGLRRLGFDDKEAKVYMASLELGPSPVQKIAERASVPRATTYLVLDELRKKGLVTTFDRGKKTFFVAESPHQLSSLIADRAAEVQQQQLLLKELVPMLDAHGQFKESNRPVVRYYEGPGGVKSFVKDAFSRRGGEVLGYLHLDRAEQTLANAGFPLDKVRAHRAKQSIISRVIYTSTNGLKPGYSTPERKARFVKEDIFTLPADISIYGNRVVFMPYGAPLRGVVIEDVDIADAMRVLFELVWQCLPVQD
jgi:sugar-specific transcriptional regulator TrmB